MIPGRTTHLEIQNTYRERNVSQLSVRIVTANLDLPGACQSMDCQLEQTIPLPSSTRVSLPRLVGQRAAGLLNSISQFVLAFLHAVCSWATRSTPSIYRTRSGQTVVTELSLLKAFLLGGVPFAGSINDAPGWQFLLTRAFYKRRSNNRPRSAA
jgi:hypothetical protein